MDNLTFQAGIIFDDLGNCVTLIKLGRVPTTTSIFFISFYSTYYLLVAFLSAIFSHQFGFPLNVSLHGIE